MIARLLHFSGRVQGVGFRATAAMTARSFDVTGWVKNLPDDRVALWAEGEPQEVHAFLAELRRQMSGYIDGEQTQTQPPSGQFTSFNVVH